MILGDCLGVLYELWPTFCRDEMIMIYDDVFSIMMCMRVGNLRPVARGLSSKERLDGDRRELE